jgi:hypothetical protein
MKIKSFGCSFIYGSDLDDVVYNNQHFPSQLTWPALIAKDIDVEYECHASPGIGNLRILENVLEQIPTSDSDDLFIIGWTWIDRFDFTDSTDNWHTLLPTNTEKDAKLYYKHLHSQYRDKLTTCIHIRTVIDTLNAARIPFIMTYMDPLMFEVEYHTSVALELTQQYIQPYMTTFEGYSFLEYSKINNHKISDKWHPLEPAHKSAAKLMIHNIKTQLNNTNKLMYRAQLSK